MKHVFIASFFVCFLLAGVVFAHDEGAQDIQEIVESETITISALGVEDPGALPTSRLYFFKEWGRGIQRLFTFNSIAKAELELRISNEKAAEAKKVEETKPSDENAIRRSLGNYQKAHERLRVRLESLKETSQNPNVDRLLERLVEKTVQHEKLFEELEEKHETQKSIIQNIRARIAQTLGEAAEKDTPEKFRERFREVLQESKGSDFKHIRSIEILDRISQEAAEDVREELEELREEFSDEVQARLEALLDDEQETQRLREILEHLPGDLARRAVLLHEIRERVAAQRAKALDRILEELEETEEMKLDMAARAEEQIRHAQEKVEDLEEEISEIPETEVPPAVPTLLNRAQEHLQSAEKAFEEGKYGEAFGQARAAEAIARNGLRVLTEASLEPEGHLEDILDEDTSGGPDSEPVFCIQIYDPVCGVDGKTYSNRCVAELQNRVRIAREGECRPIPTSTPTPTPTPTPTSTPTSPSPTLLPIPVTTSVQEITLEADDIGFYPINEIKVKKGSTVKLTFIVRTDRVYYAGLDFRSSKFTTSRIGPGDSTTVEFTADESFEFKSYWPSTGVLKATGQVIVE